MRPEFGLAGSPLLLEAGEAEYFPPCPAANGEAFLWRLGKVIRTAQEMHGLIFIFGFLLFNRTWAKSQGRRRFRCHQMLVVRVLFSLCPRGGRAQVRRGARWHRCSNVSAVCPHSPEKQHWGFISSMLPGQASEGNGGDTMHVGRTSRQITVVDGCTSILAHSGPKCRSNLPYIQFDNHVRSPESDKTHFATYMPTMDGCFERPRTSTCLYMRLTWLFWDYMTGCVRTTLGMEVEAKHSYESLPIAMLAVQSVHLRLKYYLRCMLLGC